MFKCLFVVLFSYVVWASGNKPGGTSKNVQHPGGFVGYSCDEDTVYKTAISLIQSPDCERLANDTTVDEVDIAVTQTNTIGEIEYNRCHGMVDHMLTRCGKTIDQQVQGGLYSEIIKFNVSSCDLLINQGIFYSSSHLNIPPIYGSNTGRIDEAFTTIGSIGPNGDCTPGETFVKNGIVYDRPLRNTRISVTFKKDKARVDFDSKYIIFNNGIRCEYTKGYCYDTDYGFMYWKVQKPMCSDGRKSLVYRGSAYKITTKESKETRVYVQVSQGGYDFQLLLKQPTSICGRKSYRTEHPKLFVSFLAKNYDDFPIKEPVPDVDVSLVTYMDSKLMYSMRHTRTEVMKLFNIFKAERCEMQNRITNNMLTLAVNSPKEFSYEYFNGPGYTAVTRGEVVYVAKCKEVAITPVGVNDGKCYNELKVLYNNKTMFMSPRNRILTPHGTTIPCTPGLHPMFLTGDKWVTPTQGGLIQVESPLVIRTEDVEYNFEEVKNLADGGLYTSESINNLQKILISPMEKSIIQDRVLSSIAGNADLPEGYSFTNSFTPFDYKKVQDNIEGWYERAVSKVLRMGNWYGVYILFIACLKLILLAINSIFHFRILKEEFGFWTAITNCWIAAFANHKILKRYLQKPTPTETKVDKKMTRTYSKIALSEVQCS